MLWTALTFMDRVPAKDGTGRPCIFRVVRVSGTIRKAEEEAIRQAKSLIIAAKNEASMATDSRMAAAPRLPPEPVLNVTDDMSDTSMDDG
jgi:ribonuclease P/MRP protein subunit POP5